MHTDPKVNTRRTHSKIAKEWNLVVSVPPETGLIQRDLCHDKPNPVPQNDCNSYYLFVEMGNSDFHYGDLGYCPGISPEDKVQPEEV